VTNEELAYVLDRVDGAIRTLRRVPMRERSGSGRAWPEIVRDFYDCYGYHDPTPPRIAPTAKQISEMDEVLGWIVWLAQHEGPTTARVVWAVAAGGSFRKVARLSGIKSHHTVKAYFIKGLYGIVTRFVKK
jgi:hypothetical protein